MTDATAVTRTSFSRRPATVIALAVAASSIALALVGCGVVPGPVSLDAKEFTTGVAYVVQPAGAGESQTVTTTLTVDGVKGVIEAVNSAKAVNEPSSTSELVTIELRRKSGKSVIIRAGDGNAASVEENGSITWIWGDALSIAMNAIKRGD